MLRLCQGCVSRCVDSKQRIRIQNEEKDPPDSKKRIIFMID